MKQFQFASAREETFALLSTRSRIADKIRRCSTWERLREAIAEAHREYCEDEEHEKPLLPVCKFCGSKCMTDIDDVLRETWQCGNSLCPASAMTCYTEEVWRTIMGEV